MTPTACDSIETCHLTAGPALRTAGPALGDLGAPTLMPVAAEPGPNRGTMIGIAVAALIVIGLLVALIVVLKDPAHAHHIQRCY